MVEPWPPSCEICEVGLARNGRTRFWCTVHRAPASAREAAGGSCSAPEQLPRVGTSLDLDPQDFPGGVALWGSVPAIFDTTNLPPEMGVHVHARRSVSGEKEIDATFDRVTCAYRRDLLEDGRATIDGEAAVAYYLARFVGNEVKCLFCTYCGMPHTDVDAFAIRPHRKHLCHACGRFFMADEKGVSNPLALLKPALCETPKLSQKTLEICQSDFRDGMQLWASNPAIVWLADRPEEAGIHVHAYDARNARAIDDTYGSVRIDGVFIPIDQTSYLMAQRTSSTLRSKVVSLACQSCGEEAFDQGVLAFQPRVSRRCGACGSEFQCPGSARLVVANPLVAKLEFLDAVRSRGFDEGLHLHNGHGDRPRRASESE